MNMNEKNKVENCRIEPKLKLINMDSVEVEQIEWLLYPFIPYGKVTIIQGDPGEGKTTMVLQIIAKLTRGEPIFPVTDTTMKIKEKRSDEVDSGNDGLDGEDNMQEQSSMSPVHVIYQTAEDGLGDTIKPRLLAAGADCSKVMVIDDSDQPLTMADVRLEEAIVQTKAKMVVLDPIQGFLGANVDMHRANEIRPLMKRVAVLAEKYHCAVLCKGGHNLNDANDLLYADGAYRWFNGKRIDNPNTHGTGCTLSSAIASNLAKGFSLEESVERAKEYISGALAAMLDLGKGSGPMDHGFAIQNEYTKEAEA